MNPLSLLPSAALVLVSVLPAQPTSTAPRNVLLSRGRTEPVVAVDPRNPSTIVAGSNTNYDAPVGSTYPTAYFTSHDGGRSFKAGNVPIRTPYTTGADSTVTIARSGTVFFSYLGETPAYCSGGRSAVLLTTSNDGGRGFRSPTIVDANPADDKPNMAIENFAGRRAHIFMTWTRWHDRAGTSDIWLSRSTNGGASFSRPHVLRSSKLNNFGTVPLVAPHGRVYVFWSVFPDSALSSLNHIQIFLRVSKDDGVHFGPARSVVGTFPGIPDMLEPGSLRTLTMPAVGVAKDGTLYMAWTAVSKWHGSGTADADIELSRSADGGASWSKPVRVNDARRGDRFMPSLTVLSDGSVGIAFYDRRNGAGELDLYAAHASYQGGFHVSRNVRVNATTSPVSDIYYIKPGSTCFSPGRFFGDYIGTSTDRAPYLCVVWADTQIHTYNETDVWFARLKLPDIVIRKLSRTKHDAPHLPPPLRLLNNALHSLGL